MNFKTVALSHSATAPQGPKRVKTTLRNPKSLSAKYLATLRWRFRYAWHAVQCLLYTGRADPATGSKTGGAEFGGELCRATGPKFYLTRKLCICMITGQQNSES
jgi:hypothetical protein